MSAAASLLAAISPRRCGGPGRPAAGGEEGQKQRLLGGPLQL